MLKHAMIKIIRLKSLRQKYAQILQKINEYLRTKQSAKTTTHCNYKIYHKILSDAFQILMLTQNSMY